MTNMGSQPGDPESLERNLQALEGLSPAEQVPALEQMLSLLTSQLDQEERP